MKRVLVAAFLLWIPMAASAQPAEDSNTAGRFIRDVAADYKNFLSVESVQWLGVGGVAAAAVHPVDERSPKSVQEGNPPDWPAGLHTGRSICTFPWRSAWWAIGAAGSDSEAADAGRDLLRAQMSVVSWTYAIKLSQPIARGPMAIRIRFRPATRRPRSRRRWCCRSTSAGKLGVPAFALATYTAVSRVAANQHWASDVVFGAAVGLASGRTVTIHLRDARVSVAPLAVPGGGGVLVTALRYP